MLALLLAAATFAPPWRKVEQVSGFTGIREEVQHIVNRDHRIHGSTRICMVVETDLPKGVGPRLWVHFPAGGWLYAFGASDFPMRDASLDGSATIDLRHDVVATDRDVKGSISRQPRAYVDRIINACRQYGDTFMVKRNGR